MLTFKKKQQRIFYTREILLKSVIDYIYIYNLDFELGIKCFFLWKLI